MKLSSSLLASLLLCGLVAGQQPNTPAATLTVNGVTSPTYPIQNVQLPRGLQQAMVVSGAANAPFFVMGVAGANPLLPTGYTLPTGQGIVDLNITPTNWFVLADGTVNPAFVTNAAGTFLSAITVPVTATVGTTGAVQGMVADATNPAGARLTAATGFVISVGLTVTTLTFGGQEPGRPGTLFSFPGGLQFRFYANTYTNMWVNSDGYVSFGGNSTDFTPTPTEFRSGPARAAPQWTDMNPGFGASVTVTVDQSATAPFPTVRVDWINMAEWNNSGSRHTFALTLNMVSYDIEMWHSSFNNAMIYDELMGITPGNNILPPPPGNQWPAQTNLSSLSGNPVTAPINAAIWEWFGLTNMPFYTAGFNNPFDMTGSTTTFSYIQTPTGVQYFAF